MRNLFNEDWEDIPDNVKAYIKAASQPFMTNKDLAKDALVKNIFIKIWFKLDQGEKFLTNWHHALMAQTFYRVITGEVSNVVVNQPPGSTKSEGWCIFFPAFASVNFSRVRTLTLSYSKALVDEHANRVMNLLGSIEYQELWNKSFGKKKAENFTLKDSRGKVTFQAFARSMEGQITGVRGGFMTPGYTGHIMIDDPQKPADMLSNTRRTKSNNILLSTVRSRRALPTTPVILVQQRLHTMDASGFALAGKIGMDFEHINIPALITPDYLDALPKDLQMLCWESIKDSPSRVIGGVRYWSYWPAKENIDDLIALWKADDYTFLSQYMQRPRDLTGELINNDWFSRCSRNVLPRILWRAVYVDTNSGKTGDHLDHTVFTLCGYGADGRMYVLDVERGRYDPEELLQMAETLWAKWKPFSHIYPMPVRYMAIEDKQAGQGLITTLKKRARIPIKAVQRGTDQNKLIRCKNVIPMIKTGRIVLPDSEDKPLLYNDESAASHSCKWLLPLLRETGEFSADDSHESDDIFDTLMDAIDDMLINADTPLEEWAD